MCAASRHQSCRDDRPSRATPAQTGGSLLPRERRLAATDPMTRVLVTGGGGFLGARLVERLEGDGHDVFAARRRDYDLTSMADTARLFVDAAPELVFHLAAEVGGWYDCGAPGTLLETNETLLRKGAARRVDFPGVTIHDPVYIEDGVTVERSEIGPNVTLERGTRVRGSTLRNTIVGRESSITDSTLDGALLGNHVVMEGYRGAASLGDHSEVTTKP